MEISRNNPISDHIAMVVTTLMAIGTVFVFSAGVNLSRQFTLQKFYDFPGLRQFVFFIVALLIMNIISCFDYKKLSFDKGWHRSALPYALAISIILLILVLMPTIGSSINYARRWIRLPLGPIMLSFQPSELAKWSLIFFLSAFCAKYRDSLKYYWKRFVPLCILIGLVTLLILIEDFGTAAFTALLAFITLIIGGVKFWHILTPLPIGVVAFCYALLNSPERMRRIAAFLNPDKWADGANYQATQSMIAIGSGGIFGKGLGGGISKYGHLPEDTTDFIFAIIGEELGLGGSITIILLFVLLLCFGIRVVFRCRDNFGRILASGIIFAITIQAAINLGVVTVVLPTKGIPLPFVSSGGTSLLLSAAAVGVLINIAKQSSTEPCEEQL